MSSPVEAEHPLSMPAGSGGPTFHTLAQTTGSGVTSAAELDPNLYLSSIPTSTLMWPVMLR